MQELTRKLKILSVSVLILFLMISFFYLKTSSKNTLVIGAKNCTEQQILGEILAQLIEVKTKIPVKRRFHLEGSRIIFNALRSGAIDLYVEYTGTAALDILKKEILAKNLYEVVKEELAKQFNVVCLKPLGFCSQYVLVTKKDRGMRSLSQIPKKARIAFDPEFLIRPECRLLKETYPQLSQSKQMDQVLLYVSLERRAVDVISAFSTDSRLVDEEFMTLRDEAHTLPSYEAVPLIRREALDQFPELTEVLSLLDGALSETQMMQLNYQVDYLGKDVATTAKQFLEKLSIGIERR